MGEHELPIVYYNGKPIMKGKGDSYNECLGKLPKNCAALTSGLPTKDQVDIIWNQIKAELESLPNPHFTRNKYAKRKHIKPKFTL
jgi:hypothetical protein